MADLNHAEISGDMKQLTAGMKEATKAAAALNREISSLNQLLKKTDPGNIEMLGKKQTALNAAIDDTKKKLGLLKAAFAQTKPEDVGGAQYRELERQIFSTTNQLGSYEEQMRVVQNTVLGIGEIISGTKEEFQNFEDQTKKTGKGILATITAIKEGMDEWNMAEGVTQVISSFMQIATVKKILNETTEELLKVRQEMSAMMLMDPLMIMINAVAALLPYLISWNQETIKISEATRKLVDESQEFAETTRDTAATYERTTAGIAAQTKVANEYVDQMEEIKNSSISAGDKQKQLAIIAGKLTALYPELAGKVENYVNNTNASAEALRGAISSSEAYYASQAQAERLKEVMEEAAMAEQKAAEARTKLNEVTTQYNEKEAAMAQYVANNSDFLNQNSEYINQLEVDMAYLYKEQKAAEEAYKTFSEEALRANEALETVKKTIEENTNATRMLSDEEAEYLICKQEFGRALNEEQQKELNAWKLANEATEAELQRANEEQQAIMEGRLEIVRNAFGRMSQDTAISVEDMVENLRQNANATEQWTKDMETLAGSGLEEGFLAELQEKGPAAAAQVHEIVKFMEDESFDGFAELNAQWRRGGQATLESMNLGLKDGDPTEGVDYVLNENAMAAKLDRSVPGELVNLVAFSKGEMVKAVSRQGFESVGESIAMRVSNGIYDASQKVYNAVNAMVSGIKKRINVNISTSSSGSSVRVKGFARGGILSREQIIRVAERGPEAVIPLDRLGGIVEGAMRRTALELPAGGYGETGRNAGIIKGSDNVQITVNVPISVSRSLSDADIQKKAGTISRVVGREFARMTGGRMS